MWKSPGLPGPSPPQKESDPQENLLSHVILRVSIYVDVHLVME